MSSVCNARISAQAKSDALWGRAFLDHDADDVNGFLVQASVAMQDPLLAPKRGSAWRPRSALRDAADRPRVRRRRAR
jgi:hypothetical protein